MPRSQPTALAFSFGARDPNDPDGPRKNFRELEDYLSNLSSLLVPIGAVIAYARDPVAGDPIPDIFVRCNGVSLLRSDYPVLFSVIGTTFGAADADHFDTPTIANLATDVKYFIRAR